MVIWVKSIATTIKNMYQQYMIVIEILDEWTFHSDGWISWATCPKDGCSKKKTLGRTLNKSDLQPHHDRLASSQPSHAIRKSISINLGPRTTTTARPLWYTCDQPPTDLWCFATDWRPTYDLDATASTYLCHSANVCMRWKFQDWLATDLRPCRTTYKATEWLTTNLQRHAI